MVDYLYRFRKLEDLLGKHEELRKQEIFFASLDKLNDPMEGFRDILWQGDEIVWGNLLRHYVLCLERACALLAVGGEDHKIGWNNIPIVYLEFPKATPQQTALSDSILEAFLGDNSIQSYIKALALRTKPIRRNELRARLQPVHLFAISVIYDCYERHGLMPKQPIIRELMEKTKNSLSQAQRVIPLMNKVEEEHPDLEYATDAVFMSHNLLRDQLRFIGTYNGTIDATKASKHFVFIEFCDGYVRELEKLVYPTWYTACFMEACRDSSVWGSYGNSHTGVCLKFKVGSNDGHPTLRLHRVNGIRGNQLMSGNVEHPFYKVEYTKDHVRIDFFRSLGLPTPTLVREYRTL
jgi:hypothetical protein